jgi:hypothetical protein
MARQQQQQQRSQHHAAYRMAMPCCGGLGFHSCIDGWWLGLCVLLGSAVCRSAH